MTNKSDNINIYPPLVLNGIFIKLSVISFFIGLSSTASFILSFCGSSFSIRPGSPSDEGVLYCFLFGLAFALIATIFLPRGSFEDIFSVNFLRILYKSLIVVAPIWIVVAWLGSLATKKLLMAPFWGNHFGWEEEWIQINLVLLSTSLTFYVWHVMIHNQPEQEISIKTHPTLIEKAPLVCHGKINIYSWVIAILWLGFGILILNVMPAFIRMYKKDSSLLNSFTKLVLLVTPLGWFVFACSIMCLVLYKDFKSKYAEVFNQVAFFLLIVSIFIVTIALFLPLIVTLEYATP